MTILNYEIFLYFTVLFSKLVKMLQMSYFVPRKKEFWMNNQARQENTETLM